MLVFSLLVFAFGTYLIFHSHDVYYYKLDEGPPGLVMGVGGVLLVLAAKLMGVLEYMPSRPGGKNVATETPAAQCGRDSAADARERKHRRARAGFRRPSGSSAARQTSVDSARSS
jgi:hypothetical protein